MIGAIVMRLLALVFYVYNVMDGLGKNDIAYYEAHLQD